LSSSHNTRFFSVRIGQQLLGLRQK